MSTVTIDALKKECHVSEEWLKTEFKPEHAVVANHDDLCGENSKEWAKLLGEKDLKERGLGLKSLLERWSRRQLSSTRTFGFLVKTFLEGENAMVAQKICQYLKDLKESGRSREVPMTYDCTCTEMHIEFLDELKKALEVYKSSKWSDQEVFDKTKLAISNYMEKSISTGISDPEHLFEVHVHDLYKKEMLFSDSRLLDEPRNMAKAARLQLNSPLSPQPNSKETLDLEPSLFSKEFLFHASLCCQIVNESTRADYTNIFKEPHKICHEFDEMSMMTSNERRCLVAKKEAGSGDKKHSICYIAFYGGLDKAMWPIEYSDVGIIDAIQQVVDKFPAGFVEELLREKKRVILTGFSIGGILACALLVKIQRDYRSSLSQTLLQKNLACITFSQPHFPVPGLGGIYGAQSKIADSIHVVLSARDVFPRLLGILYHHRKWNGGLQELCDAFQMLDLKDSCEETVPKLKEICCGVEPAKAIPSLKQPMTYHLLIERGKELVCEELSGEELAKHSSYELNQVNDAICSFEMLSMTKVLQHINQMVTDFVQTEKEYTLPSIKSAPKRVVELEPEITRIEVHKYSIIQDTGKRDEKKTEQYEADPIDQHQPIPEAGECNEEFELALAVEGRNLWFFSKVTLKSKEVEIKCQEICGNSVQVNFSSKDEALRKLSNGDKLEVGISTSFNDNICWELVKVYTKEYAMSKRQKQLAKLSPPDVIELSYLCALLEKQSSSSNHPISARMDAIRGFLEKVIDVVPLESLGFSIAFAHNPSIREKCVKALKTKLLSSQMMDQALLRATADCECQLPPADQQEVDPSTGSLELRCCSQCSSLNNYRNKMQKTSNTICDLNVRELFDKLEIKSPIEALRTGRAQLDMLSKSERTNVEEMLAIVNEIRKNELAVCISLLGSFMDQQETKIPLINTTAQDVDVSGSISIGVWVLSSFSHIREIMSHTHTKKLEVSIKDHWPCLGDKELETHDSRYSSKLRFIVQGLDSEKIVTYNSQYVSYSLEKRLLEYEKGKDLETFDVKTITEQWDKLFQDSTLALVAKSHRSVIARWLKWSLMIHNLREELAKHTAVGVVGLVNSGKSTLIKEVFGKIIPTGTTRDERTTIPFIYNIKDEVDVVDFPGVDDADWSIGELADFLIKLTQITVFVVDYRKALTESTKKWVEKLKREDVPVLVCFSFADRLFIELQEKYEEKHKQSPPEGIFHEEIKQQLLDIRKKLVLPDSWKCEFYFFALKKDSNLNNKAGRKKLKKEGIRDHSDVGLWLKRVFKQQFFQDMPERLIDVHTSAV